MAKRKFKTWALAEEAHDRASKDAGVLQMALTDVLRNRVDWIRECEDLRVGISRLDAPHGGIAILEQNGYVAADYLDNWVCRTLQITAPTHGTQDEYDHWVRHNHIAREAKRRQNVVNEELKKKAGVA